ncbi:hypothetical protein [Lunatibacter salilacus]|uniref:hypothetical protein n=1 Tax=Lunatibacter salilacus TaxID=2483804 RepID=UPI00131C038F|nr:hypothetical protein [Lunatibacter salilacus]
MKTKKKLLAKTWRMAPMWAILTVIFVVSCHDRTFWDPEIRNPRTLDYEEIEPGTFVGEHGGAKWQLSLPNPIIWNSLPKRYLFFYAHGIVDPVPYEPVKLPEDKIGGVSVEDILNGKGIGYASSSYRDNGLVVLEAVEDMKKLADLTRLFFKIRPDYSAPDILFIGGPSEGGLVTVKTIEKYGYLFDGGISICAPIGSFQKQLQYNGNFHVLFNYFFGAELMAEGIDLGNPKDGVHPDITRAWKSGELQQKIILIMQNHPTKVLELMKTAKATVDYTNPVAVGTAVLELLRFNMMFSENARIVFKGVPFNNWKEVYSGSSDDRKLNREIQRINEPDYPRVRFNIWRYETSGTLIDFPLVTIHTTGDYIIPFWHDQLYASKIFPPRSKRLHKSISVNNFGHSTIFIENVEEALAYLIGVTSASQR